MANGPVRRTPIGELGLSTGKKVGSIGSCTSSA